VDHWNGKEPVKILITNQTHWEVTRVLRGYRARWTGTETLHRDGKPHWGLGDCQLRSGEGQTRHFYLVLLVHSLLMAQLRQGRVSAWAQERLTTIGQACRVVLRRRWAKRSPGPLNGPRWITGNRRKLRRIWRSLKFAKL